MWRKSSSCASGTCVEVEFQRSSFCATGMCVEVQRGDTIRVRDTAGNICEFDRDEWAAFVAGVRNSEFDVQ